VLNRRQLFVGGGAAAVLANSRRKASALEQVTFAPNPGKWRSFMIATQINLPAVEATAQVWVPLPSVNQVDWSRAGETTWRTNATSAGVAHDAKSGAAMLHLSWDRSEQSPNVEITSNVQTRDRAIDLGGKSGGGPLSISDRESYLAPTAHIPTGGIVKQAADHITSGAPTDVEKARLIYEWIIQNGYRDVDVRGCGTGNIVSMLESRRIGGKCADLNGLFVGLARASGIPARHIYGIRVAPSRFGYKSLGANTQDISSAQHCRAEVHLAGYGWVAADPADVLKVILEESPGHLSRDSREVRAVQKVLFGACEGNWIGYNFGQDIALPGAAEPMFVGFLMYPQGEIGTQRCDCLSPGTFKYSIQAHEIAT